MSQIASASVSLVAQVVLVAALVEPVWAAEDGGARLPPLGWRSWNFFACEIDAATFERQIDALVDRSRTVAGHATSLADLGFDTVGIDDCWQDCMSPDSLNGSYHDANGNPLVDKQRFPDMRALSDYGKVRGIKLGWYGNNCPETLGPGRGPRFCGEHGKLERDWPLALKGDVAALLVANFSSIKLDNPGCGAGGGVSGDMQSYYTEIQNQQQYMKILLISKQRNNVFFHQSE